VKAYDGKPATSGKEIDGLRQDSLQISQLVIDGDA